MRPLTERRDKHLPLRDVSGMLRSFQYAAASVTRAVRADEKSAAKLQACAGRMSTNFLEAYAQAIRGCPSFPADLAQATDLLRLFVIEKALYEIGYELANRPDWTDIPLAGVLAIVDGADAFGFSAPSADSPNPHHGPGCRPWLTAQSQSMQCRSARSCAPTARSGSGSGHPGSSACGSRSKAGARRCR